MQTPTFDPHAVRHNPTPVATAAGVCVEPRGQSASKSPNTPVGMLLWSDQDLADALGVSMRTCHEIQREPWAPKPVVLGPRLKRHRPEEWDLALASLPRPDRVAEPAQLQRGKAEKAKRAAPGDNT